ncbi:copper homeostasis protein CutC [Spirochaetia bacterium]|nr:copper homeostasis protein CutC [Spirochaetia bacterium]
MKDGITLELCIENATRIEELAAKGADRFELCDNLAVGGTTVSYGVAENAITRSHAIGVKVMCMIRPRGGNFVYDANETAAMLRDIEVMHKLGTDGLVFGCLTQNNRLDKDLTEKCITAARGLETTFHMAFDHIRPEEQLDSLRWLADRVTRILTHGSADLSVPVKLNFPQLRKFITAGKIEILVGGGVTKDNYRDICAALNVKQIHGTRLL